MLRTDVSTVNAAYGEVRANFYRMHHMPQRQIAWE